MTANEVLSESKRHEVEAAIAEVDTFDVTLAPTHRFRILAPDLDSAKESD